MPPLGELAVAVLFLIAWLFPVIAAWVVSVSGYRFSLVALQWQNQNADSVGLCILLSLASGAVAAFFSLVVLSGMATRVRPNQLTLRMNKAQRFFLVVVSLIAAVGLFKSFGGTIFEKSYAGPSVVWLGYGAWNVTFLLSINLLFGDHLAKRPFHPLMAFAISVLFLPFLLSGSRIDFLSSMLALVAYVFVLHDAKFRVRTLWTLAILAWAVGVALVIGSVRYESYVASASPGLIIPAKLPSGMFYLSTIGDIGASVFQVIGLIQLDTQWIVGAGDAASSYVTRLLPGPYFPNRPGDLHGGLPELIGGGALHALGEGYLIYGTVGCIVIGAVFGVLGALSGFAGQKLSTNWTTAWWIVFAFPWLMLIRGGWYQFFSLFKAVEVLLMLVLMLVAVGWLGNRYSEMYRRGPTCR